MLWWQDPHVRHNIQDLELMVSIQTYLSTSPMEI